MPQLVRTSALSEFDKLVADLGGEPGSLFDRVGLDSRGVAPLGQFMPHRQFSNLLEFASTSIGCPDFGMQLGTRQTDYILGPIALVIRNAENFEVAIRSGSRYIHLHDQAVRMALGPLKSSGKWLWSIDLRVRGAPSVVQNRELAILLAYRTFSILSGNTWQPVEIWFEHQAVSEPTIYQTYFPCRVRFAQPSSGIVLDYDHLRIKVHGRDEQVSNSVNAYLREQFGEGNNSFTSKVESLIRPLLAVDCCSNEEIASILSMHTRTLSRHLLREGTSFEIIKDRVRQQWAEELLRDSRLSATYISGMLGYANSSAFTRCCTRWFGNVPRIFRQSLS